MPIQEYSCEKCGMVASRFFFPMAKRPETVKCKCGARAKRKIGLSSFKMGNREERGFMSNGKTIKKDAEARRNVRSHYFGDDSDSATFVK